MMSTDQVLGQLDLTLTDEIVKNIEATGESFKKEIWNDGSSGSGLLGYLFVDKSDANGVRLRISGKYIVIGCHRTLKIISDNFLIV